MLMLCRKRGETIVIDDKIKVVIASIKGSVVRVGIEAPKDVNSERG